MTSFALLHVSLTFARLRCSFNKLIFSTSTTLYFKERISAHKRTQSQMRHLIPTECAIDDGVTVHTA